MVAGQPGAEDIVVGEPRWHMASAVVAAIILTILLPDDLRIGPVWLVPLIEGGLLVALIVGDPGKIDRRSAALRTLSLGLVSVLILVALRVTVELTDHLIHGGKETNSAEALLEAGAVVWLSNILAFAVLYWELDGGGAAERAHRPPDRKVDLAFPQQMSPEARSRGLAASLRRLPLPRVHQFDRVQPHRCDAAGALGQDRHGRAIADFARHPRPGDRPRGEHLHVG